jgi:hypothetical protein
MSELVFKLTSNGDGTTPCADAIDALIATAAIMVPVVRIFGISLSVMADRSVRSSSTR